jgi:hypothetical protein
MMETVRPTSEVSFETTVRSTDAIETYWQIFRRRLLIMSGVFVVMPVVFGFAFNRELFWILIAWGLIVALVYALIMLCLIVVCGINTGRRSKANGHIKWTVGDKGINMEDNTASLQVKWSGLKGFVETGRLILPRFRNSNGYLIVPKRCLDEATRTNLIALLSLHLSSRS